ncbi:MAG: cell division protein FtsQ/DivIB [Pseudomonadales bacterium]
MLRELLATLTLLIVLVSIWLVWQRLDQPVTHVRVEGQLSAAEQQAVRNVLQSEITSPLQSLDLEALRQAVAELSWPRAVMLRRVWPDSLVVRVEKESVVARWGAGGYLTSDGKVVQVPDPVADMPLLAGTLATPREAMETYQLLQAQVRPLDLRIDALTQNALGEWQMTLENGVSVALGRDELNPRVQRFLLAYRRLLVRDPDRVAHVDARYDNGVAVSWGEPLLALGRSVGAPSHSTD